MLIIHKDFRREAKGAVSLAEVPKTQNWEAIESMIARINAVLICTGIFLCAYRIVCIVLDTMSSDDRNAGEELRNPKNRGLGWRPASSPRPPFFPHGQI